MKRTLTLTLILFAILSANSQTNIPVLITSNQTWGPSGSPYTLTKNSYVDTGVTITILPGTILKSASSSIFLTIHGEIVANGKANSLITFDGFSMKFGGKNKGYNNSTGKGLQFDYCHFKNTRDNLVLPGWGVKLTNCKFSVDHYGIKGGNGIYIDHCTFTGGSYPMISCTNLNITNSHFDNFSGMYAGGKVFFKKNTFNKFSYVSLTSVTEGDFQCNTFKNSTYSSSVMIRGTVNSSIDFLNNTLDSLGRTYMMSISMDSSAKCKIQGNNFLHINPGAMKLFIGGTNWNPLTYKMVDLTSNFWSSTDTATIKSYISDNNDDINNWAKADISNFLGKQSSNCKNNTALLDQEKVFVSVFPNPATGKVYIKSSNVISIGTSIHVMNQMGKVVLKGTYNSEGLVDLRNLSNGLYFIHIMDLNKSGVTRVLLNK